MPGGRNLGDAFVVIWPDISQFVADLTAKVTTAVKSFKSPPVTVPVNVDTKPAETGMAALVTRMQAMAKTLATLRADADTKAAEAKVARIQAQIATLAKQMSAGLVLKADTGVFDAKIAAELANLARLRQQASNLQLDLDAAKAAAKIALLTKQIRDTEAILDDLTADVDIDAALTKIIAMEAEIKVLRSDAKDIELTARTDAFNAAITASVAKVADLRRQQAAAAQAAVPDPAAMANWTSKVLALEAATEKLTPAEDKLTSAGRMLADAWAGLNTRLAVTPSLFGKTMAGFSGLHLIIDGLIEVLIVAVSSFLALAAGAAVAYPAIDQVAYNFMHLNQVMTIFSQDQGPLAKTNMLMDKFKKQMAPQVIEAYGGALQVVGRNTEQFAMAGAQVVHMFDLWIARIDVWMGNQKNVGGILQSGIGYLGQLARIIGTVAQAIDNLLTKDPGIAGMLLQVIQLVASAINWFSQWPAPIVKAVLAIHGLYLWGSLLLGLLLKLVTPITAVTKGIINLSDVLFGGAKAASGFVAAMDFLLTEPVGWFLLAAAGVAAIIYETNQASGSTKSFIAQQEQLLNNMTASQAATYGLATGIGNIREQMRNTGALMADEQKNWSSLGSWARSTAYDTKAAALEIGKGFKDILWSSNWSAGLQELGHGLWDSLLGHGGQALAVADDIKKLNGELDKMTGSYRNLYGETGNLMKQGFTFQQALGLMDAAGVKWNDTAQQMNVEVENLIHGYEAMSVQGTILTNSVNALNFQTELQDSKVTQLNSAWDTFFKTVSGGASGFNAFASQTIGLYQSLGNVSDTLSVSNGRTSISMRNVASAGASQTATLTGLNAASLQARDAFLQTADAANTQIDNLTTMAAAAGLGAKGTDMLSTASKAMVETLLPAAKGSQEMTAILEALAEHGGFQPGGAANMFSQLAKWAGNVKDPMGTVDKITAQLTTDTANLTQDVKNLSVALGTTLNNAMSTAIFNASGGQKVFDEFATAVLSGHKNVQQLEPTALKLAQSIYNLTGNTTDAKNEFLSFAQGALHMSTQEANQLWDLVVHKLTPAVKDSADKGATPARKAFEDFAGADGNKGLGLTKKQTDQLWQDLKSNLGKIMDDLTNKNVPAAKLAFEQLAGKTGAGGMGLTKQKADELWQYFNGNMIPLLELLTGTKIPATQKAFEAWAGKGGAGGMNYTTQQADALYKKIQNDLNPALNKIPPSKTITVTMKGDGSFTIQDALANVNQAAQQAGRPLPGSVASRLATGGRLPGWGGGDVLPAMLEPGETVLPKQATADPLTHLIGQKYHVPGFAAGGVIAGPGAATPAAASAYSGNLSGAYITNMVTDFVSQMGGALTGAMSNAMKTAEQSALFGLTGPGLAAGKTVLAYAETFEGKVPYVWGGSTPAGWDCSGFVSWIYDKFGIYNGRTDAAGLQSWGKMSGPVPGGMVFFGNPAHHVGFIVDNSTMLSALGTQWGTIYSSLAGNSGFEVPPQWAAASSTMPGGVGWAAGNPQSGSAAAAQDFARSILWAFGWGQGQWPPLDALWNQESGWNANAVNPSSGAAGIPQDIRGWADFAPGDYANQIRWGLAYISGRYGSPAAAWAHEIANNWYAHGGIVPGFAQGRIPLNMEQDLAPFRVYDQGGALPPGISIAYNGTGAAETIVPMTPEAVQGYAVGGIITAYRSQLIGAETAELKDYAEFVKAGRAALAGARPGSYVHTHHKSILDEMATLARRQTSEGEACQALRGGGLTISDLGKFITAINHEITTSHDVALSHLPGRTLIVLRSALAAIAHLAANPPSLLGAVGPGAETLFPAWPTPTGTVPQQQFWYWLPGLEHDEKSRYEKAVGAFRTSLRAAKAGTWAYTHRATIDKELTTLALRQNEQLSDYNAVMTRAGYPPTASEVRKLQNAVKSMAVTVQDADLNHIPGGHPALMASLYQQLGEIYDLTGKGIGNPETPWPSFFGNAPLPKRGTQAYATLASIFGWYDRGGILPPGLTLAYNGTGRNEVVSPVGPAGTYGPGGMTPGEMQLINRLDRLIAIMGAAPAAYSQALNGVAAQASSRGYYGGTR